LFVHYIIEATNGRGGDFAALQAFPKDWYEIFTVIPNLLLALSFHNNFFPIFKGMR
jgi:amino acid permease